MRSIRMMLSLLAIVFVWWPAIGSPLPKNLPVSESLSGKCSWGDITQTGKNLTITGGSSWSAVGRVNVNGHIVLTWTQQHDGRTAFGVYRFADNAFSGHWGWSDEVELDEAGDICGEIRIETFARTP